MSYVVLARKYRPQRFDDMVGQEHVGRTLGNAIRQDRVHHAYLFAGARGLGKTTTARIFAKGLVCEQGPTPEPCNVCEQCLAVSQSRSVDVVEIDGASNNSVDNIRNLREQVHYLPQSARRKVYIIDEVHMLTTAAFNALLKTLEEPPEHVNFIFATTEPQKVLPTILSRVSRLDFRRVSVEESVAHLRSILEREGMRVDDGGLRLIARASGGSVRDGLTLLDQVIAFANDPKAIGEDETRRVLGQADRTALAELVDALVERSPEKVIATFDQLVSGGLDLMVLSMQILEHLRDLMLVSVCQDPDKVLLGVTQSELDALSRTAALGNATLFGQLFDRFSRVVERLPNSRVQRLLVEMALLELAHSEPVMPLGDLVERLQQLGSGGSSGGGGGGGGGRPGPGSPSSRGSSRPSSFRASAPSGSSSSNPARPPRAEAPSIAEARVDPSPARAAPAPAPVPDPVEEPPFPGMAEPRPEPAPIAEEFNSELMQGLWKMAEGLGRPTSTANEPGSSPSHGNPSSTSELSPVCQPPAPPEGIIELDNASEFDAWTKLVARVREEDEYVSAILRDVGLVSLRDGLLKVAAPLRSFSHNELSGPELRARVEQATREHFGRAFRVELVEGQPSLPDLPSITLVDERRRLEHRRAIEREAQEHATLRSLVSAFNGKIAATRPLSEG